MRLRGADASSLVEGRSASANGGVHQEYTLPKDTVAVTRPDGSTIYGPDSTTKKLMAPPRANFQEVYAAGERIADLSLLQQIDPARTALHQFGTYDFQRDKATNTMSMPQITPLGSIWRAQVTGYINPSPLPKPMLSSIHQTHFKWTVISCSIVCALTVVLFLGLIAYLSRDTCDDTAPSPVVRNSRGDTAEGQVQVCTWIGTVVNNYITIQFTNLRVSGRRKR
jgi:hypothetical protein